MSDDEFRPPSQGRQLLGSLLVAAALVLGTMGVASAKVETPAASCSDDGGGGSDDSSGYSDD